MSEDVSPARIIAIRYEAEGVLSFILRPVKNPHFPPVEPGAHVDVQLPNGLMRSYSLSNGGKDDGSYRLTVACAPQSKGGSAYMHQSLRAGQVIGISAPRNNFMLAEEARFSVFIAGGIGVTPFLPMIVRLNSLKRAWRMHYCVRTRERAALLEEITTIASEGRAEVLANFDEEPGGAMLDMTEALSGLPGDTHVYCCGPIGMLNGFRKVAVTAGFPDDRVHYEYFSSDVQASTAGGFTVKLAKSGMMVPVHAGQSILHAVIAAGVDVPYSCEEGVCGACEVSVLGGLPDHRDKILSDNEREDNRSMMICCSGSKSPTLVLDL